MSRYLVVLRAGDNSLHHEWLQGERTWHLAISYYGLNENKDFPEAAYIHRFRGGKWDGLYDFFAKHASVLDSYDYFWLPDDDIATNATSISELFELTKRYRFELAQPALTTDSYFSYLNTLKCRCFTFRNSTIVEIMVPVLHRSLLSKLLPHLGGTQSGFGLDSVWHRLTTDPRSKVAIIDQIAVHHTRPVGGELAKQLGHQRLEPVEELNTTLQYWSVSRLQPSVIGGVLANGLRVNSGTLCTIILFLCWGPQWWRFRWWGRRNGYLRRGYRFVREFKRQFLYRPDLTALAPDNTSLAK